MSHDLIVPERGFSPVGPGIACITLPIPFSIGSVNVYVLEGPPLTLIDTGPCGSPGVMKALEAGLQQLGHRIEDIEQLILTHAHIDHFGLAAEIRRRADVRILCHPADRRAMEDFEANLEDQVTEVVAALPSLGYPAEGVDAIRRHFGFLRAGGESVAVDAEIEARDRIVIGEDTWTVHHCPGHSAGLVTLHSPERRMLIADDHVLRFITPNPTMYSFRAGALRSGLPDYIRSLGEIRDLPVDLAVTGHGPEVTALRDRIDEVLVHHEERKSAIHHALRLEPLSAAQLVGKVFGRLGVADTYLATRECLGHVVLLLQEGLVSGRVDEDGATRYGAVA